jgi:hypothetical protein
VEGQDFLAVMLEVWGRLVKEITEEEELCQVGADMFVTVDTQAVEVEQVKRGVQVDFPGQQEKEATAPVAVLAVLQPHTRVVVEEVEGGLLQLIQQLPVLAAPEAADTAGETATETPRQVVQTQGAAAAAEQLPEILPGVRALVDLESSSFAILEVSEELAEHIATTVLIAFTLFTLVVLTRHKLAGKLYGSLRRTEREQHRDSSARS